MEKIIAELEKHKKNVEKFECPICKSKRKFIDDDIEALPFYAPESMHADELSLLYVPCIQSICCDCGYMMQFSIPRNKMHSDAN